MTNPNQIDNLRNEYHRTRRTANQFTGDTNEIFDFKVATVMGDMGLDRTPENFVWIAHEVLHEFFLDEDRRQAEQEDNDHMGYDTLQERDMDREEY